MFPLQKKKKGSYRINVQSSYIIECIFPLSNSYLTSFLTDRRVILVASVTSVMAVSDWMGLSAYEDNQLADMFSAWTPSTVPDAWSPSLFQNDPWYRNFNIFKTCRCFEQTSCIKIIWKYEIIYHWPTDITVDWTIGKSVHLTSRSYEQWETKNEHLVLLWSGASSPWI